MEASACFILTLNVRLARSVGEEKKKRKTIPEMPIRWGTRGGRVAPSPGVGSKAGDVVSVLPLLRPQPSLTATEAGVVSPSLFPLS